MFEECANCEGGKLQPRVEFYGVGFADSYGIFQNRPRRNPVCVMKKEERPSEKDGYRRRCRRLNREKGLNEFR